MIDESKRLPRKSNSELSKPKDIEVIRLATPKADAYEYLFSQMPTWNAQLISSEMKLLREALKA